MNQISIPPAKKSLLLVSAAVALAAVVYWLLPGSVGELPRRAAAIFVIAALLWATEALPLFATSLCVIGLEILLLAEHGGLAREGGVSYREFLSPFSSGILVLFMGGFLLSAAVTKHGLDKSIAALILRPFTRSPLMLIYGVLGITAFFSMWMSNTATTAMMLAIVAPLLKGLPERDRYHRALILAVPFGANIGGIGTPIGTPPNAVAVGALRGAGYTVSFLDWMVVALPLAVLLLALVGGLLYWFFPPGGELKLGEIERPAGVGVKGKLTLMVMGLTICLWLTGELHGVATAVVALIAAALLTAMKVLDRWDVDSIDWDVLILMWGGLSLGRAMEVTGLVDIVTGLPIAEMQGFWLAAVVVGLSVLLSTFMSNTATANLIVPMAMAMAVDQRVSLVVLTALSCSFAMAMPVSTPPNAIAFGTGRVPAAAMMRTGLLISVVGVVALLVGYRVVLPLFLDVSLGQ